MIMQKKLNKEEVIKLINSLGLSNKDFTVLSSGALVLKNIMDGANDLDIAVNKKGFEQLKQKYSLIDKGNNFYIVTDNIECVIDDMKNKREKYDDYYLQDIECYLDFIEKSNREKDKLRIIIIKDYLKQIMQYKSIEEQNAFLIKVIKKNKELMEILEYLRKIDLPNFYIAAGCVFQTIWNYLDNKPLNDKVKDIDIIYYDNSDLSKESELAIEKKISQHFNNMDYKFDVHNEARMHLWKEEHEHVIIDPYKNSEDAISRWLATLHAIGITLKNNKIKVYAPYGFNDIYSRTVRPIKHAGNNKEKYDKKAQSWKSRFENIKIVRW